MKSPDRRGGDEAGECRRPVGDGVVARGEVRQHVRDDHVEAARLRQAEGDDAQDRAPVVLEDLLERVLHHEAGRLRVDELGRLRHLRADDEAGDDEHRRQQERQAPCELVVEVRRPEEDEVGEQEPERNAGLRDRGVLASLLPWRVLERHEDRAAPFRTEGDALDDADEHEEHGSEQPDLLVGRQHADEHRGDAHQEERADEHRLAADPVAEVAADDAAEGAHREADAEGGEAEQHADHGILRVEEDGVEVERRGRAVRQEVVVLDGGADGTADGGPELVRGAVLGPHIRVDRHGRHDRFISPLKLGRSWPVRREVNHGPRSGSRPRREYGCCRSR